MNPIQMRQARSPAKIKIRKRYDLNEPTNFTADSSRCTLHKVSGRLGAGNLWETPRPTVLTTAR